MKSKRHALHSDISLIQSKDRNWYSQTPFKRIGDQIHLHFFKLQLSPTTSVCIALPIKKFNFFDFYVHQPHSIEKDLYRIEYIREHVADVKEVKYYFSFHVLFFADLKHIYIGQIEGLSLSFEQIFEPNCVTPLMFVLPWKDNGIDFQLIQRYCAIRNYQGKTKAKNIKKRSILQARDGSRALYEVIHIIDNFETANAKAYFDFLADYYDMPVFQIMSIYDMNPNINLETTSLIDLFIKLCISERVFKPFCRNFIEFINNKNIAKNVAVYVIRNVKSTESFRYDIKYRKVGQDASIQSKKPFPRLMTLEYFDSYIMNMDQLSLYMKTPALINSFLHNSRILGFFEQYPIIYKKTSINYLKAFTPKQAESNFNLEFLETIGDTVLKLITIFYMTAVFDKAGEGDLTNLKSSLISNKFYSEIGSQLNLHHYLLTSSNYDINFPFFKDKTISSQELIFKRKNLSDSFEAIIAAMYLESKSLYGIYKFIIEFTNIFLHNNQLNKFMDEQKLPRNEENTDKNNVKEHMSSSPSMNKQVLNTPGQNIIKNNIIDNDEGISPIKISSFEREFTAELCNKVWKQRLFTSLIKTSHKSLKLKFILSGDKNITLRNLLYRYSLLETLILKGDKPSVLEKVINYEFKNKKILLQAINLNSKSFERYEFFGDVIHEFICVTIVGKMMLKKSTCNYKPKFLQKAKIYLTSNNAMKSIVYLYNLQSFIISRDKNDKTFNKPMEINLDMRVFDFMSQSDIEASKKISDMWESLTFAIMLDGGYEALKASIMRLMAPFIGYFMEFHEHLTDTLK